VKVTFLPLFAAVAPDVPSGPTASRETDKASAVSQRTALAFLLWTSRR
jgi:hypothetical protein